MRNENILIFILLIFLISILSAQAMSSSLYSSNKTLITAGGGNTSSTLYQTIISLLPFAGGASSTNYQISVGLFFYPAGDVGHPTASLACSPTSVLQTESVTCACTATDDYDTNLTYSYALSSSTSATASESTSSAGVFTETCTVYDDANNSASSSASFTVNSGGGGPPPTCSAGCGACTYSSTCSETGTQSCITGGCSSYTQTCTRDTDGISCGASGQQCSGGTCTTICTTECSNGAKECSGSSDYHICGDYNVDGCYEWSAPVSCNPGEGCSSGVCVTLTEEEQEQIAKQTGGAGGGGKGCTPNWNCTEFGECSVYYNVSGHVMTRQKQDCTDLNNCYPASIKELPCKEKVPITTQKTERCGEKHIMIFNNITGKIIADIKESELNEKPRLDISLATDEVIEQYCDYCYNSNADFDEIYIDCGGSCPACYLNNYNEWNSNQEIHLINVSIGEEIFFSIAKARHSIKINNITKEQVSLTINSEPIQMDLKTGEIQEVDIDNNGMKEFSISLGAVNENKADITLRKMIIEKEKISLMSIIPSINFPYSGNIGLFLILMLLALILSNAYYYFEVQIQQTTRRLSSGLLQKVPAIKIWIANLRIRKEISFKQGQGIKEEIKELERIDRQEEEKVKKLEERLKEKRKYEVIKHVQYGQKKPLIVLPTIKWPKLKLPKFKLFSVKIKSLVKERTVLERKEEKEIGKEDKKIKFTSFRQFNVLEAEPKREIKIAPQFTPPKFEPAKIKPMKFNLPKFKFPKIKLPKLKLPQFKLPSFKSGKKEKFMPELKKTKEDIIKLKEIDKKQEQEVKKLEQKIKEKQEKKKFKMPKLKIPQFKMPKIKFHLPKMKFPKFNLFKGMQKEIIHGKKILIEEQIRDIEREERKQQEKIKKMKFQKSSFLGFHKPKNLWRF